MKTDSVLLKRSTMRIEYADRIAVLCFDKPPVNAIDLQTLEDSEACLLAVEAIKDACALVITGTGTCFSAGLDLKTVPNYGWRDQCRMIQALNQAVARLYTFPIPTIAAINGHAIAGGFIVVLTCDYRIAVTQGCTLGLTEARAGIPFPYATMEVVKAELSSAVARRLTLVGRTIGSEEALALNVLDELQPPDMLLHRAREVAMDLGSMPRQAYARIKHQLRGEAIARIQHTIKTGGDPLLDSWIKEEARKASAGLLERDDT